MFASLPAGSPLKAFGLPKPGGADAMEVVGIPLKDPGLYLVEIESARLGASLLGKPQPGQRWLLDGAVLGEAADFVLWPPEPGRHRLSVVARDGRILDTVTFVVRGASVAATEGGRDLSP
jgi:hypothetical protein